MSHKEGVTLMIQVHVHVQILQYRYGIQQSSSMQRLAVS